MQFITITGLLDRIVARIKGAWINGVIDAVQRSRMIRGWTDECRRYVTSMQELRTRTMQEALNAGKRQEARIIEQRVEKDAANDRMVEKAKVLETWNFTHIGTVYIEHWDTPFLKHWDSPLRRRAS